MEANNYRIIVGNAPHVHSRNTTSVLMLDVIAALMPCVAAGAWLFGWGALGVVAISTLCCVALELLYQTIAKKPIRINDLSAVVTGIILGLNLPVGAPWWMILVGAAVAVILVKQLFGGIGDNFVNPAIAARAVLLASWPARMTAGAYVITRPALMQNAVDALTSATPNAADAVSGATPLAAAEGAVPILDLLIGRIPGSIGEVCKIAILIGLVYLLIRKTITWHIPVVMIGTFMAFSLLIGKDPVYQVLSGSILFGAVFMATDYVTSPMTSLGKVIYAACAGLILALIRYFGSYPEGTTYAILLANVFTPLIDRFTKRRIYGTGKQCKEA